MPNIISLIKEMKFEIFKNILLITFLKSVIVFYIFDIIKSFMDFSYIFSFIFAGIYFVFSFSRQIRKINIKIFEEHNPEIKEMLTTAADNANVQNIVVEELIREVFQKVKKVSSGTLIVPSMVLFMILSIPILAIIDYELNPLRIDAISQDKLLEGLKVAGGIKEIIKRKRIDGKIEESDLLDADIYGDRKIAKLGDKEIQMKLNLGFETDLTKPKEEDKTQATFKDYPDEEYLDIEGDAEKHIETIQETDLANKYNEKLRKLG